MGKGGREVGAKAKIGVGRERKKKVGRTGQDWIRWKIVQRIGGENRIDQFRRGKVKGTSPQRDTKDGKSFNTTKPKEGKVTQCKRRKKVRVRVESD